MKTTPNLTTQTAKRCNPKGLFTREATRVLGSEMERQGVHMGCDSWRVLVFWLLIFIKGSPLTQEAVQNRPLRFCAASCDKKQTTQLV